MNKRNKDFNLIASLGLQDAVKEWGVKYPGELEAALGNLNTFNQTGRTPFGSSAYHELFIGTLCRFSLGAEEAGKIAFGVLTDLYADYLEQGSREERWVLYVFRGPSFGLKPKPYYESMIRTISIALSEKDTFAFATQLAGIHPELCQAVHNFLTGKLKIPKDRKK